MAELKLSTEKFAWHHLELRFVDPTNNEKVIGDSPIIEAQSLTLDMSHAGEPIYGHGRVPISLGRGNVAITGSIGILHDYYSTFINYFNGVGRESWTLIPDLQIHGVLGNANGVPDTVDVYQVQLTSDAMSMAQGNTSLPKVLSFNAIDVHVNKFAWTGTVKPSA